MGKLILYILSGYILLVVHDYSQMKKRRLISALTYTGYLLILLTYISIVHTYRIRTDTTLVFTGVLIALIVIFTALLFFSVFIEIPVGTSGKNVPMSSRKEEEQERNAYDRGTYKLSRHPGFIWMLVLNLSLFLLFNSLEVLILLSLLTLCNLILIIIEDKLIFPAIFRDYEKYKQKVPFLLRMPFL